MICKNRNHGGHGTQWCHNGCRRIYIYSAGFGRLGFLAANSRKFARGNPSTRRDKHDGGRNTVRFEESCH